ncbi:hypothetical protein AB6713_16765 [Luteimonas sp. B3_2_R+30]|uniref:Uncharacterized protein n=1 Tax=Luteimonas salinilitoris TaxID=3237697 RepID=A0ABV4HX41_9GAMM
MRARILVKAYPQPSHKYEETVCVAAASEDGREMLRLYPVRYRHLSKDRQFERFDLIEMDAGRPRDDHRPESRHVDEDSIRIVGHGRDLSDAAKVRLWKPFIAPSLKALHEDNKIASRSFGIVKPDPGSMQFFHKPVRQTSEQEQALSSSLFQQNALFQDPLKPLDKPEYSFGYRFTSGGHAHTHLVHDWEVQAAYFAYRKRYGDKALNMLQQEYGERIPTRNPHFIMGTMKAHPQTFIVIGILRSGLDPADLDRQAGLF